MGFSLATWQDSAKEIDSLGVELPSYEVAEVKRAGRRQPVWIHVGGGNLYRAFHAQIAQALANKGLLDRGVVVAETFSPYTVDTVYAPFNCDILQVEMGGDGSLTERLLAATSDALFANPQRPAEFERMKRYFASAELQLVTFTITEKGYGLTDARGTLLPQVAQEIEAGSDAAASSMGIVCALLLERYRAGAAPLALVSTDNFSQNGKRFRDAILVVAEGWRERGHVAQGFIDYVSDEGQVSFPWSMIDRITPNPSPETAAVLKSQGWDDLDLIDSGRGPRFAGFANTEPAHYLVIEDSFPNGRPALEEGGVIMCDRATAERADTMKVTACLNPLHTCLAVYGCLLGYTRIWQEMEDPDLVALIRHLGYDENLPMVEDPGVIDPVAFLAELLEHRLPNKSLPDAPQRIAADTSQKMPIRFGHTLNAYRAAGRETAGLTYIPLVIAGWLRYLIAVDDAGAAFTPSPDPLLDELQGQLAGIAWGERDAARIHAAVGPILSNGAIFDCDLYDLGLGETVERMLMEELAGPGAVAATIKRYL